MRSIIASLTLAFLQVAALVSPTQQADLAAGVEQVKQGNFAEAVLTLDGVLAQQSFSEPQEAIQAHLYLGVAYAGLDQAERAKAEFREALRRAPDLRLGAEGLPPKAVELFEAVRAEAAAPAEAKPAAGTTPAEPGERTKRSGHKRAWILGGAGAAVAAVGAAALGGSNHAPTVSLAFSPSGTAISAVTQVTFTAGGTDSDNDVLSYDWNFGDGGSASGVNVNHVFGGEGTYNVTVTVRDGKGASATATTTVQARTVSGVYRPDNENLRDYELTQNGPAITGVVDPGQNEVGFEGMLTHPREISLEYIYDDEGRTCFESIKGTFDPTLARITGTYSCTVCRPCRRNGTFPIVLTKR